MLDRIVRSNTVAVKILFIFGCTFLLVGGKAGYHAFKPEKDFQYLVENEVKSGLHIKGELPYTLGCFARDGATSYYVIPVNSSYMALKVYEANQSDMEALLEETMEYCTEETKISKRVSVDGYTVRLSPGFERHMVTFILFCSGNTGNYGAYTVGEK